jgi:hypothetical protein
MRLSVFRSAAWGNLPLAEQVVAADRTALLTPWGVLEPGDSLVVYNPGPDGNRAFYWISGAKLQGVA